MRKNKLLLLLALLMTAATGAWAQEETLLTTITPTGKDTYSETTAGVVTVTLSNVRRYDGNYGWLWKVSGSVTVEAKEGYTITRCVFKQNDKDPVTITTSPFAITFDGSGDCVQNDAMDGVTSIEVYGNAPAASGYTVTMKDGVKDADKWTVKVGEGQAQALPIGGLKGDGKETVTLQYNGRLKVKGVKATSDAAAAEATYTLLSAATTSDCGKVVCAAGHLHDAKTAVPDGCTAVGILGKVTETGHGLILALQDATSQNWNTINGWESVTTYAGTTLKVLPDDAARGTNLTSYTALGATAVSNWAVGGQSDYQAIFKNLGGAINDWEWSVLDNNVNAYITTGVGGSALDGEYWTAWTTEELMEGDAIMFSINNWTADQCYNSKKIRPVLGFGGEAGAPAAKPAATVTTAPTGAAIVGVGKNTALVSGGATDGGTLWYAVTTTNTKPASTDGFSGTVPTAEDITASGTVYVWYYVKGDDTHSDSEIAATAIEVPVADIVWDATNIMLIEVYGTDEPYEMEGITLSANADEVEAGWADTGDPTMDGISFKTKETGGYTFTAPTGKKFTKIEMNAVYSNGWDGANLGTGWKFVEDAPNNIYKATWKGSASSTVDLLKDVDDFGGEPVKSIAFYLVDAE